MVTHGSADVSQLCPDAGPGPEDDATRSRKPRYAVPQDFLGAAVDDLRVVVRGDLQEKSPDVPVGPCGCKPLDVAHERFARGPA